MAASGRTSAPVAACGILLALGAPNSYNFIYSRFPFNGWIGAFTSAIREPEFAVAERLLEQYAFDLRLRALDAIQIAVALMLKRQGLLDQFVAADKVLCEVAILEGFAVLNPEHP
jgi:hypothetical protein